MSDIEFIMADQDSLDLASFLFDQFGAHIAIDDSPARIPAVLTSAQEFSDLISSRKFCPLLFVTSKEWGGHRLYTKNIEKDGKSSFFIMQRYGAPSFTWSVPRSLEKNGRSHLVQGLIGDYPWFYPEPGSNETIGRPDAMEDAFKKISKFIRTRSTRCVWPASNKKGPWVTKRSFELVSQGAKLGGDGQWIVT